ncbi:hypothetical protein D3C86_1265100 [compost metagenome]
MLILQEMVEEGGLARAKKAGDEGDGDGSFDRRHGPSLAQSRASREPSLVPFIDRNSLHLGPRPGGAMLASMGHAEAQRRKRRPACQFRSARGAPSRLPSG